MHERMKKIPICTSSEGQRNFTYPQKYSSSKLNQKFDSLTHFLRRKGLPEGHEFELKLQIGTSVMARWFSKNGLSDLWFIGTLPKRLTPRQNSYVFPLILKMKDISSPLVVFLDLLLNHFQLSCAVVHLQLRKLMMRYFQ